MGHRNIYKLIHPMKFEENFITENISRQTQFQNRMIGKNQKVIRKEN